MYLSLSLSFSFCGHVMSPHHSDQIYVLKGHKYIQHSKCCIKDNISIDGIQTESNRSYYKDKDLVQK